MPETAIFVRPISTPLRITIRRWSAALITSDTGPDGDLSGSQRQSVVASSRACTSSVPVIGSTGASAAGWSTSAGAVLLFTTTTVMPMCVTPNRSAANCDGRCTQPCDSGYPGSPPACSATPSQVRRSWYGIAALLYLDEWWSLSFSRMVKIPVGVSCPGLPVLTVV